MSVSKVSDTVKARLPRYYRFLGELQAKGVVRISSSELARKMGITASQIRQDFNCFGGFGQQGYGYNIALLRGEIGRILGVNGSKKMILIGAGNLGRTIAEQINFKACGFELIGIFDKKESLLGQLIGNKPVRSTERLDDFCREYKPDCAILCLPREAAERLCDQLVNLGIRGIWNFSHYDISVKYPFVAVENVHLNDSLRALCFKVNQENEN